MRTVDEVKKHLKRNTCIENGNSCTFNIPIKTEKGSGNETVIFHNLNEAINDCIVKLWNDEEITAAFVFNENSFTPVPVLLTLTNNRRLFISRESSSSTEGFIFTSTTYFYEMEVTELKYVDLNKCRILEQKNESFFGKPKPSIRGNLIVDDKNALISVNLKILEKVYAEIIKNINTYGKKPAPKAEVKESGGAKQNNASATANSGNAGSAANSGNVAEIRKLYEDGIITREEMLDLIKSAVSK